jgi:hypothetical protein
LRGEGEGGGVARDFFTAPVEKAGVLGIVKENMVINELRKKSDGR